ncbi:MAG TPA: SDR family oxidoreductase [Polyangia bacterium]|nr:SDR family oxidoreductase [Polyangia bacterium]
MDLGLSGCVALVAAASRGLGFASAQALAHEGADLALCARTAEAAQSAARAIADQTGRRAIGLRADVRSADQITEAVASTVRELGRLDILVTNAGGPPPGGFRDADDAGWTGAFELNVLSAVRLVRAALPHLERSGRGRVILLSSTSVKQPIDGLILSNAVRIGVAGLAKSLANELGPARITVNQVCPGRIDTDRVRELDQAIAKRSGSSPEQVRRGHERAIPLGRYGRPEEFGAVVAFLASQQAAYITGTTVQVDGGLVRGVF